MTVRETFTTPSYIISNQDVSVQDIVFIILPIFSVILLEKGLQLTGIIETAWLFGSPITTADIGNLENS